MPPAVDGGDGMTLPGDANDSMTTPMRKEPYSIRLAPKQRQALEAWAVSENRTLANLVETILTKALDEREPEKRAPAKSGRAR
jgi:hypothetical protein